jgi:hypothetical protein
MLLPLGASLGYFDPFQLFTSGASLGYFDPFQLFTSEQTVRLHCSHKRQVQQAVYVEYLHSFD